jgi:hypothetical protein
MGLNLQGLCKLLIQLVMASQGEEVQLLCWQGV